MEPDVQRPRRTGRGAFLNPRNRFERTAREPLVLADAGVSGEPEEEPSPGTLFFRDASRSVIARNDSPDLGFGASLNPYRGCEHGCVYCYARPTHEYLGFSAGLDFESRIMVKEDAPELLRRELSSPKWTPQEIFVSGVTDCYQPVERRLKLTRRCLEVLAEFRNPFGIVTKNFLVTRDADVLARAAAEAGASVALSVTTLDETLSRAMEPRASRPAHRLKAIELLAKAGVPVGVNAAPMVPGLTDHELPAVLKAAADAGARFAGYTVVRLPHGVKDLFERWLQRHFPERRAKVLNRIREVRGGKLYDAEFGSRMRGRGAYAEGMERLFRLAVKKAGLNGGFPAMRTDLFRRPVQTASDKPGPGAAAGQTGTAPGGGRPVRQTGTAPGGGRQLALFS
jgi:DNA repair photolyase